MATPTRSLLLVGSVNLPDAETVFCAASKLSPRLRRIPDGETGERATWTIWVRKVFDASGAFEPDPEEQAAGGRKIAAAEADRRWAGEAQLKKGAPPPPRLQMRAGVDPNGIKLGRIGYAEAALQSYGTFVRLRAEGTIPKGVRFQVALPTTAAILNAHIVYRQHAVIEPIYRRRLLAELAEIFTAIPADDLAVQWDVSTEMAQIEGVRFAHFRPVLDGIAERLAMHCNAVPRGVELGVHLCYGNFGNRHWMEPNDTGNMVRVANALAPKLARQLDWLHMPVPIERHDDAYFAPLAELKLPAGTELYLGLVHHKDGVAGTRARIATAQKYAPSFGIGTECGLGRVPPEWVGDLLDIHAAI
ncbi:MAG: hypothetical protein AB7G15_04420 [Alphaproteobacteria bacterium]